MSKPVCRIRGRNVKKHGYMLVEKCGTQFRLKINGFVYQDWIEAYMFNFLESMDKAFYKECGFKRI